MEAQETIVFIREAGQEEFDILYLTGVPEIDAFHQQVKEALGISEDITKLTMDGIAIRNANGIRFLLKKQEPKVEVTFTGTGKFTKSLCLLGQLLAKLRTSHNKHPLQGPMSITVGVTSPLLTYRPQPTWPTTSQLLPWLQTS